MPSHNRLTSELWLADVGMVLHMRFTIVFLLATLTGQLAHADLGTGTASEANSKAYEHEGVRIVASINAQVYTWEITNLSAEPIMHFSVPEQNTYNQNIPPGWEMVVEDGLFTAWTDNPRFAIRPGLTRTFDARTGSAGSMLGPVPATLGFTAHAADIVFPVVWGPVPKHRGIVVVVVATLMALGLLHVAMLRRLEQRST